MKIRHGFVSNSSSASFIIPIGVLTEQQIYKLLSYQLYAQESSLDGWLVQKVQDDVSSDEFIRGFTIMDNGDMDEFLSDLGISTLYVIST